MEELHQGQQWMIDVAHILDAPLPEFDTPKPSARLNQGARVQQQLNRYLSQLQKQRGLSEWLMKFRSARQTDGAAVQLPPNPSGYPSTLAR